ncbi:MAG: FlaD/FlaE family flagellar protein [Candidatus Thermoplasmatota archaeon]
MGGKKEEKKNRTAANFDLKKELTSFVEKDVIPPKVAAKLEEKLKEKNVEINKDQLHKLVYKIRDTLQGYMEEKRKQTPVSESRKRTDEDIDMSNLMETVDRIEERLEKLEEGVYSQDNEPRMVTTDEIEVADKESSLDVSPLTQIPNDPESVIVLMKWLQFLVDKCSRDNLPDVLDYYVDIGWISEEAKINLLDYSNGITEKEESKNVKGVSELPSHDHIQSFIFIQKLKGHSFDRHFIDRIDGEISRITKKLDNYNFK